MQPKESPDVPVSNSKPSKPKPDSPEAPIEGQVEQLAVLLSKMSPDQLNAVFSRVYPGGNSPAQPATQPPVQPKPNPVIQSAPPKYPEFQQAAAAVGAAYELPAAEKVHWTILYPDAAAIDPRTGAPRMPRPKTGAQFSARQLEVENLYTKQTRRIVVLFWMNPKDWPILKCEKVVKNVEVVFDHEDERDEFLTAFGSARFDPLILNDQVGSAFDIKQGNRPAPNTRIAPPPGGYDLYSKDK